MQVAALGHAGLRLDTSHATLLMDPWFSPNGTFQASWFQYPENAHILTEDLYAATAVAISHEHLDHVDGWFLHRLQPHVPVIIPRYPSPALRNKVAAAGRKEIIEVSPWEPVSVAEGVTVFFVSEASPMNHDSAIVVVGDGRAVVNLNDARLTPRQFREILKRVEGRIGVFAAQGSGASWHPMVYDLPEERKRAISRAKRVAKFRYLAAAIRLLEPGVTLPFAGPMCFLDPELFQYNREMEGGVFPDQEQVVEWLRKRGAGEAEVLLPGDIWDMERSVRIADPVWHEFSFADRWDYLKDYAARKRDSINRVVADHPEPTRSLWEQFREYFQPLLEMNPYFDDRVGMRVGFDIVGSGGGRWAVDFRTGSEGVYEELGDCGYRFRFASRWLPPILEGRVPWEDFFLTLRFRAWRSPDVYNDHLLGLLKFAKPQALHAVEAYETSEAESECIRVETEGCIYEVQRNCPHAGGDLEETGEVLSGRRLRCLNHYYEFDLETGKCLNGSVPNLQTRRVK